MSDQDPTLPLKDNKVRPARVPRTLTELPSPGALIAERWELLEHIGEGGMSDVYKARHVIMNKFGAVKFLKGGLANDAVAVKRFQQEALTAGSLSHSNIVQVHDCGLSQYGAYLILDYLEGVSLFEVLEARAEEENAVGLRGSLRFDESVPIFLGICDALEYAHKKGVVHRDIKPSNVMLVEPDIAKTKNPDEVQAKLVDFGIAKMLGLDGTAADGNLTRTGEVFGSPTYMSPEQCLGQDLDGRADIYSMGCLMHESLTGLKLLMASNATATMMRHVEEEADVTFLANIKDPLARPFSEIIAKCMRRDPDERYHDVGELRAAIAKLDRNQLAAQQSSSTSALSKPLILALAAASVLAIGALSIFAFWESPVALLKETQTVAALPISMPLKQHKQTVSPGMISARIFDGGEGVVSHIALSPERKLRDGEKTLKKADQLFDRGDYENAQMQYEFVMRLLGPLRLDFPPAGGPLLRASVGQLKAKALNKNYDALDIWLGELIMNSPVFFTAPPDAKRYALQARATTQLQRKNFDAAADSIGESLKLYPADAQSDKLAAASVATTPANLATPISNFSEEVTDKALWTGLMADVLRISEKDGASPATLDAYSRSLAVLDRTHVSDLDYAKQVNKFRAGLLYRYGLELEKAERYKEADLVFQRSLVMFREQNDTLAPEVRAAIAQSYLCLKHSDRLQSLKYRLENHL